MIFLGDIHGNFNIIDILLSKYNIENDNIIQLGDFGVGFNDGYKDTSSLYMLNKTLQKRNVLLHVIRGNHDNPIFWKNGKYNYFSNIKLIKDYSIINIDNLNILMIGGGISIDRSRRTVGINYWVDEIIKYKKMNYKENIDIVVTHVPPPNVFENNIDNSLINYYYNIDKGLKVDIQKEKDILDNIKQDVILTNKIKYWFSGHMHKNLTNIIDNIQYKLIAVNTFHSHTTY